MAKTAFIGLGVMGYPMAGHLSKAGHEVCVYNRTTAKAESWASEFGGTIAMTPAEAARDADFVCSCVGNDNDLRNVVFGSDGILAGINTAAIYVDHTTASADVAREIGAKAKDLGIGFLDAPVSGGQAGAKNGALSVMVGGAQSDYDAAESVIQCYAKMVKRLGPVGSGQLTKMVNQICIAGLVQGLSEGLAFAEKAGLDARQVVEVISQGAAQSWQMDNRYQTMLDDHYEHGFAVEWMRKDLAICLAEARNNGARLPVTAVVDQFYAQVQTIGGNRWDTSSLMKLLKD